MRVGEDKTLTLKNGETVNARDAVNEYDMLQYQASRDPSHMRVLYAIARGNTEGHPPDSIAFLRAIGLIRKHGNEMRPLARSVLSSALTDTHDGTVLINPFRFKDESEQRLVDEIRAANAQFQMCWMRNVLFGKDDDLFGRD